MFRFLFTFIVFFAAGAYAAEPVVPSTREQITFSFAPVVKKVMPAVVNIYTRHVERVDTSPFMSDPLLREFFGNQGFVGSLPRERVVNSLGSGVIVGADGIIVTSYHVIKGSDQINVVLSDRREFEGHVVKIDEQSDLAVLKVDTGGAALQALQLRDSGSLEVGDLVLAVGNPFGVGQTVTSGIISALARSASSISDYQFFIQTDAAINPGNSGGALVDMEGRLIGINTAIYSRSGGYQGIGFAIPADMVRAVLNGKAGANGSIIRPWLGLTVQPVNSEIAQAEGLGTPRGALVQNVAEQSPAEKAGIKAGDILLTMDGGEINDMQSLNVRTATIGTDHPVKVEVWRNNGMITLTVTLSIPPSASETGKAVMLKGNHPLAGIRVITLTRELAQELNLKIRQPGVLVLDAENAESTDIQLEKGDIILDVNDHAMHTVADLESVIATRPRYWNITLLRDGLRLNLMLAQ